MLFVRNNHDRSWIRFGSTSKQRASRHCLGGPGQGLQLHSDPVGQAYTLPGISRTGVEQ